MKFFFDTEFIEDGKTITLLSIGIVSEDGRTYYAEPHETDQSRASAWVKENVIPFLTGPRKSREEIRADILRFVGKDKPEFWAYYADYDWVVLCQLFGTMMDLPKGWPMYCRDIKQLAVSLGDPQLPRQEGTKHNALQDARHGKLMWEFLNERTPDPATARVLKPEQCFCGIDLGHSKEECRNGWRGLERPREKG